MCDQFIRKHTAFMGIQNGVNIHQTAGRVTINCQRKDCKVGIKFQRSNRTEVWNMIRFSDHVKCCRGWEIFDTNGTENGLETNVSSTDKYCVPAYTAKQVARCVISELNHNPYIHTKTIASIIRSKGIYSRQTFPRHHRAVGNKLLLVMKDRRAEDIATLQGYARLLNEVGHTTKIMDCSSARMREIRVEAAKHIYKQMQKAGSVPTDEPFDVSIVDTSDIADGRRYYCGLLFVSSTSSTFCKTA